MSPDDAAIPRRTDSFTETMLQAFMVGIDGQMIRCALLMKRSATSVQARSDRIANLLLLMDGAMVSDDNRRARTDDHGRGFVDFTGSGDYGRAGHPAFGRACVLIREDRLQILGVITAATTCSIRTVFNGRTRGHCMVCAALHQPEKVRHQGDSAEKASALQRPRTCYAGIDPAGTCNHRRADCPGVAKTGQNVCGSRFRDGQTARRCARKRATGLAGKTRSSFVTDAERINLPSTTAHRTAFATPRSECTTAPGCAEYLPWHP